MKNKLLIISIVAAFTFLFGCSKNNSNQTTDTSKQTTESENNSTSNFPFLWQDPCYNIYFTLKKNQNQFIYELAHNGVFATGECVSESEKLTMKYPEEKDIKFSSDANIKDQQLEILKTLFGNEKTIELVFDENHYYSFGKGYYVHGDVIIPNYPKQTQYLTDGDTSYIYDTEVILNRKYMVSKKQFTIYEQPDVNSKELLFSDFDFSIYDTAGYLLKHGIFLNINKEKIQDENGKYSMPLLPGMRFYMIAKSAKPETINGKTGYWYAVQNDKISDYILHTSNAFSWIFASDDEVEEYDEANALEYTETFADAADLKGYIEKVDLGFTRLKDSLKSFDLGDMEVDFSIYYTDDDLFLTTRGNENYFVKLNRNQLYVDDDGFLKLKLQNKELLIIEGKMLTQDFSQFENDGKNDYTQDEDIPYRGMELLEKIEATSSYSEVLNGKTVNYTPDNLFKCFDAGGCRCHPYFWNYKHIPWVEGADGAGIGESVTITFNKEIPAVSVLNGFTDISNLKLYKQNPRVKTLLVEDLTNGTSKEVFFRDYAYFNCIEFDKPTQKVRLTIKEVYEGTKYSDTCISAVIPHKEKYSSESDYESLIRQICDYHMEQVEFSKVLEAYGYWFGTID